MHASVPAGMHACRGTLVRVCTPARPPEQRQSSHHPSPTAPYLAHRPTSKCSAATDAWCVGSSKLSMPDGAHACARPPSSGPILPHPCAQSTAKSFGAKPHPGDVAEATSLRCRMLCCAHCRSSLSLAVCLCVTSKQLCSCWTAAPLESCECCPNTPQRALDGRLEPPAFVAHCCPQLLMAPRLLPSTLAPAQFRAAAPVRLPPARCTARAAGAGGQAERAAAGGWSCRG